MTKVKIDNNTQSISDINYQGFDYVDASIDEVNNLEIKRATNQDISQGDELQVDNSGTIEFVGNIRNIESHDDGSYTIHVRGRDEVFQRTRINNTFSGVSYETMVKNAVENNTAWTVQTEATNQTVDKKEYDDTLDVLLRDARKATGFQLRVDTANQTLYFEDEGSLNSGSPRVLSTTGQNANIDPNIDVQSLERDTTSTVNKVKVVGNVQRKNVVENKTASANQTTFTVNNTPLIRVNKVEVNNTKKTKALTGDSDAGDYYVEFNNGEPTGDIIFHNGLSDGDSVDIDYDYSSQPSAVATTNSADADGFKKIKAPSVTTDSEAQDAANSILNQVKKEKITATVDWEQVNFNISAGELMELNDSIREIDNNNVVAKKVTHSVPGTTTIELGEPQNKLMHFELDKRREQSDQADQQFDNLLSSIKTNQIQEQSQWTSRDGWEIDNANDTAKQVYSVYIHNKKYLRYVEIDLLRTPLKQDTTSVSSESPSLDNNTSADSHDHNASDSGHNDHGVSGSTAKAGTTGNGAFLGPYSDSIGDTGGSWTTLSNTVAVGSNDYLFHGWFVNARLTIDYGSGTTLTGDFKVRAKDSNGNFYPDSNGKSLVEGAQGTNIQMFGTGVTIFVARNLSNLDFKLQYEISGGLGGSLTGVSEIYYSYFEDVGHDHGASGLDDDQGFAVIGEDSIGPNVSGNTVGHDHGGGSTDTSEISQSGSETVKVDVTNGNGTTTNVVSTSMAVGDEKFGFNIPASALTEGFNKIEVYPNSSTTIRVASQVRQALTDRE